MNIKLNVKLEPGTLNSLKSLAKGYHGRALRTYTDQILASLGDLTTVTAEDLEARKQAIATIREAYISFFDRLKAPQKDNQSVGGEYQ